MKAFDHDLYEVAADAEKRVRDGWTIHQKWTCSHCGSRQTMGEPNKFFTQGQCEECGHVTDIKRCNFMAIGGVKRE